jgi:hypothetical protein
VKNYVENDIRKMGIVNWRQLGQDWDGRRRETKGGGAYPSWIVESQTKKKKEKEKEEEGEERRRL